MLLFFQRQQGLKRKKDTIEVKYQRPAVTEVRRETSKKSDVGRLVIDETVKPFKKVRREPLVGRIEDMNAEESSKQEGIYPSQPRIGSLLVKDAPTERESYEVCFFKKNHPEELSSI